MSELSTAFLIALCGGLAVSPLLIFLFRSASLMLGLLRARWLSPLPSLLSEAVTTHRVGFLDCDPNLHITNSRYLSLVDWGRFHLLLRLGFGKLMSKVRYRMLMGTSCIRYRRSIDLFRRYHLHNRLLGWDDKWVFVEHRFVVGKRTAVMVVAKFVVTDGKETVAPALAMAQLEQARKGEPISDTKPLESPPLPDNVRLLLQDSDSLLSPD